MRALGIQPLSNGSYGIYLASESWVKWKNKAPQRVHRWTSGDDALPDNERPRFDPPLGHEIILDCVTYSTHRYIWWPMWFTHSKWTRKCSLLGRVDLTVISVIGGPAVLILTRVWSPLKQKMFSNHATYATHYYINFKLLYFESTNFRNVK